MSFSNELIVIVGGTSGIGLATAKMGVEQAARVIITGRDPVKTPLAASSIGPMVSATAFDAADAAATQGFFAQTGPFDHLVLALSGGKGAGPFHSVSECEIREGFDSKFFLHWTLAQASLPTLRKTGSITFITAASARMGVPGTVGLAAINGAIQAMVKPLAAELKPVRVNAVSPGIVETSWWNRKGSEQRFEHLKQMAEGTPIGRAGHPEEVASAVCFVMSNAFMTGAVIDCDGGVRVR